MSMQRAGALGSWAASMAPLYTKTASLCGEMTMMLMPNCRARHTVAHCETEAAGPYCTSQAQTAQPNADANAGVHRCVLHSAMQISAQTHGRQHACQHRQCVMLVPAGHTLAGPAPTFSNTRRVNCAALSASRNPAVAIACSGTPHCCARAWKWPMASRPRRIASSEIWLNKLPERR